MTWMRAAFLGAILIAPPAFACQCGTIRTATEARDVAVAVFEGTAEEQIPTLKRFEEIFLPTQKVRFRVHHVWKGKIGPEVTLLEGPSNCSWNFAAGERYLVFATPHESEAGWMDASRCVGPTGPIASLRTSRGALGEPQVSYRHDRSMRRGRAERMVQHARVYFLSGLAALYAVGKGGFEWSVWSARMWIAPVATVVMSLVGIWFLRRRLRRHAIVAAAGICVLGLLIFVLVLGASFVHTVGWWFEHLLETPLARV